MIVRKKTNAVCVGGVWIGGGHPVVIQSMNCTDTRDIKTTLAQIQRLAEAGCDITRVAILDREAALALKEITAKSPIPVVADIHFDYSLALAALENGAAKIRINPGNLGGNDRIYQVASVASERGIPIRVGVNSGSISPELLRKFGGINQDSMIKSVLQAVEALEKVDFHDIVVSIKSSDVPLSLDVYRTLAEKTAYPLHIGITEAGTVTEGAIRSAVGIGTLLAEGIGDTLRVSLTGDPVEEVYTALRILKALEIRNQGMRMISCPTCGRTQVPMIELAEKVEKAIAGLPYDLRIAVMGCVVNGPGEARNADLGIAGGKDEYLLFKNGEPLRKIKPEDALEQLIKEIHLAGKEKAGKIDT